MFVENIETSGMQFPGRETMFVENIENHHLHFPVREIIIWYNSLFIKIIAQCGNENSGTLFL